MKSLHCKDRPVEAPQWHTIAVYCEGQIFPLGKMLILNKLKFIYCSFLLFKMSVNMPHIRFPPRCKWELMGWWLAGTHVSEKKLSVPFSRVKMGPEKLYRKVCSYPSTLRNIPEERKVSVSVSYYKGSSDSAIVIGQLVGIGKKVLMANFELLNQNVIGQNEKTTSILLENLVFKPEFEYLPNTRRKSYRFKQRSYWWHLRIQ